jgi:ubiquinone/menaquinone biosynthesis C-methylase UbiE
MNNAQAWEQEYKNPQFLTLGTEPLAVVKDFFKELRRKQKIDMSDFVVLDLGCGNGKNLAYAVENFCKSGIGYDISKTAIDQAEKLSKDLPIEYQVRSIGEKFSIKDGSIDIILDVTSSNSLNEQEREIYLQEMFRVLKPSGFIFVRALCLDGDKNAKQLIKEFPGKEQDTYTLPDVGVTERVFSKEDFVKTYEKYFKIIKLEKTEGYQKWGNQSYKRNYWVMYAKLKS